MAQTTETKIWYIGPESNYSNKINYSTIEQCYEYCKNKTELGEDIETTIAQKLGTYSNENIYKPGLDPYLSKVVMLQIGDVDNVYVIDTRTTDISILKPLWEDRHRIWVGHNLKFETKHLLHNYQIIHHKIWDTMLVDQNLYNGYGWSKKNPEGYRFSLEALSGRYLGIKAIQKKDLFTVEEEDEENQIYIDKSTRLGFLTIGNKLFTEEQILYGANDIVYPLLIRQKQLKGTGTYNPVEVHELENEFCLVLSDIEYKGLSFSKEQWLKVYQEKFAIYQKRLKKLNEYVEKKYPKFCAIPDLFNPDNSGKCLIEWSSSKQVIELFRHIDCCPKEKSKQTGKIEYTVGAKALQKLLSSKYKELYANDKETEIEGQEDLILNYLLCKTSEQACTTFGEDWLKYLHPVTGKIHSEYKQILHTGRMSSNKPNVQNIPAEEGYRKAFIGNLVNADYSSQESRILAELSGDEAMIAFFNEGHPVHGNDYHSFTATKMFSLMRNDPDLIVSKKTHKEERDAAKNISFKIAYGGSAYTLKDDFGVEEEVAQEFIDSYMKAFPALDRYFIEGKEKAIKQGYIDIIPDRRYWEPDHKIMNQLKEKAWSWYPKDYSKMSKEQKEKVKTQIAVEHPEIKEIWKEFFTIQGEISRASQNYPIQGMAGAQTKMAGILFRRATMTIRDKMWLTNIVHDETLSEYVEGYGDHCKELIEQCMVQAGNMYCKKVKMEASASLCSYWHH